MKNIKYLHKARDKKGNIVRVKSENFPGDILQQELDKLNISQKKAAAIMGIPTSNINDMIRGVRPISVLVALRLEKAFGMDAAYWINLQVRYLIELSRLDVRVKKKLSKIKPFISAIAK
ncbi:MAG: HigA family addiction module antidote protein [Chitinophagaceae bacterium]|nr:HigA family addiction module antidote protein [Chitinophagaceae bacterium]